VASALALSDSTRSARWVRAQHLENLAPLHDAQHEREPAPVGHAPEQTVERSESLATFDVTRGDGRFRERTGRGKGDPAPDLAPAQLEGDEPDCDADQEPANRGGIAHVSADLKKATKTSCTRSSAIASGPRPRAHDAPYQWRVANRQITATRANPLARSPRPAPRLPPLVGEARDRRDGPDGLELPSTRTVYVLLGRGPQASEIEPPCAGAARRRSLQPLKMTP